MDQVATYLPLGVLFLTAYLMSKAYLTTGAAKPLIERLADHVGHRPEQILLGYLFLVAAFSLILPNVIAALAFLPILPTIVARFAYADERARKRILTAFALATMWGANIGGMGAMIGGLSNAILVVYAKAAGVPGADKINFLTWFYFGIPVAITLCLTCWAVMRVMLARDFAATGMADARSTELLAQGAVGAAPTHHLILPDQRRVYWSTLVFLAFWTAHALAEEACRQTAAPLVRWAPLAASLLFGLGFVWHLMRPRGARGPLLPLEQALRLPWRGIVFIVGSSAISLALVWAFDVGRYAGALARWAHDANVPDAAILFALMMLVAVATELLNNVVVALAFFPIIHEISQTLGFHPLALLTAASLMSTATFILPTGAPSNAIVIGETRGFQFDMAIQIGLVMALSTAAILTLFGMYVIPRVLGL